MNQAYKELIEKVQKLLTLANSSNEHEAKLAAKRAHEIMLRHNLTMQSVEDHSTEYLTEDAIVAGKTVKFHQLLIGDLITEFFFCGTIINTRLHPERRWEKVWQLVGREENVKVAGYVFSFLTIQYPILWKQYREASQCPASSRKSYFIGLTSGINSMLIRERWSVEEETGLVVIKDAKVEEKVNDICEGRAHKRSKIDSDHLDYRAIQKGQKDGKELRLRKPLESSNESRGIALSGRVDE